MQKMTQLRPENTGFLPDTQKSLAKLWFAVNYSAFP